MTLAEAVIGAAALGAVSTAVANNSANKANAAQQQQQMQNAANARAQALQGYDEWLKKHPQPTFFGVGPMGNTAPSSLAGQPNAAPGGPPQPGDVAQRVLGGMPNAGARPPMPGGAGPQFASMPSPRGLPPVPPVGGPPSPAPNIPPNVQAILSQLAQGQAVA